MGDRGTEPWQGYVALLDILGFSALVSSASFAKEAKTYAEILEQIIGHNRFVEELSYVTFSDTVVITAGSEYKDLLSLLQATGEVSSRLLCELGWPVRGAISFGQLIRIRSERGEDIMVAGQAIVDAYHFEKSQDWVGVMLTPKALANLKDDKSKLHRLPMVRHYAEIPFSSEPGGRCDGFVSCPIPWGIVTSAIELCSDVQRVADPVWKTKLYPHLRDSVAKKLRELRSLAPDPRAQRKYTETLAWIKSLEPNALLEIAQLKKAGVELFDRQLSAKSDFDKWKGELQSWKKSVLRTLRRGFSEVHALHFENLGPIPGDVFYSHQFNAEHHDLLSGLVQQLNILAKLIEKNF